MRLNALADTSQTWRRAIGGMRLYDLHTEAHTIPWSTDPLGDAREERIHSILSPVWTPCLDLLESPETPLYGLRPWEG